MRSLQSLSLVDFRRFGRFHARLRLENSFFFDNSNKKKQTCAVSSVTVFGERPKVSTEPTRSAVISVTVFGERPTVSTRCQVSSFFKKKWAEPTLRHYGPKPFPPDG